MKKLLPLLLLTLAVIVSGCVGQEAGVISCPGEGVTDGVTITDFSFDFNEIYGGESVGLTFTVENFGGEDGTLNSYQLFGPDMVTSGATSMQWEVTSGDITSTGIAEDLSAPNMDLGIPGGMYTELWTIKAPGGLTVETPVNLNIRATYTYKTSFSGVLTVMTQSYLSSLPPEERKALIQSGGLSAKCYTGGPMKLQAAAGTHFVDPSGEPKIRFVINNVGPGYPFWPETGTIDGDYDEIDDTTKYRVHVPAQTSGFVTCLEDTVTLSRGEVGTFDCSFDASSMTVTAKTDYNFQIEIEYYYWQDSATAIRVLRPL
jgi:hypothetical protein